MSVNFHSSCKADGLTHAACPAALYLGTRCPHSMPEHVLPDTVMGQNYARKHGNTLTVWMTAKQWMSVVPDHVVTQL